MGPEADVARDNERQPANVEHATDINKESKSTYYIESFPAELGAGAVWGEDIPFFERVWCKQQDDGSSLWGPFEDQDEWEPAKWLIRNVGQKQINALLNLNIVRSHHFITLTVISWTFDRRRNK